MPGAAAILESSDCAYVSVTKGLVSQSRGRKGCRKAGRSGGSGSSGGIGLSTIVYYYISQTVKTKATFSKRNEFLFETVF